MDLAQQYAATLALKDLLLSALRIAGAGGLHRERLIAIAATANVDARAADSVLGAMVRGRRVELRGSVVLVVR